MQKELGGYLLPVLRKKYNTVRHLKKYTPKAAKDGPVAQGYGSGDSRFFENG